MLFGKKICPVGREHIDQYAFFEADAAVLDAVRFQQRISGADNVLFPIDLEFESAADHIGDLRVRMVVALGIAHLPSGDGDEPEAQYRRHEKRADGTRRTTRYDIDLTKCIFCGFCEEACPVDAIVETRIIEYHGEKRGDLYYTKPMLLAVGDRYEESIARDRAADAQYR